MKPTSASAARSRSRTFSILERIDVGETGRAPRTCQPIQTFSILERIDVGETSRLGAPNKRDCSLSVSSNGSTWVKRLNQGRVAAMALLSVSSNGSTWVKHYDPAAIERWSVAFSILERIDVGETRRGRCWPARQTKLSVSSNGSTWVKLQTGHA